MKVSTAMKVAATKKPAKDGKKVAAMKTVGGVHSTCDDRVHL